MTRVAIENPYHDGADEDSLDHHLDNQWTLRYVQGSFKGPLRSIAVLYDRSGNSSWKYNFQWSESGDKCIHVIPLPPNPTCESPFKTGCGAMRLDRMRDQLLKAPDCFCHSYLERNALTEASLQLQVMEEARKGFPEDFEEPGVEANEEVDGQSPSVYPRVWTLLPWQNWDSNGSIATISSAVKGAPLPETDGTADTPTDEGPMYSFHFTENGTITVSAQSLAVCKAWNELSRLYRLQLADEDLFYLTDVFCFLQTESELPIPPPELQALKRCVVGLARAQVDRLGHPTLAQLKAINEDLRYEYVVLTLCLRKESPSLSEVSVSLPIGNGLAAWTQGELFQVMTTKGRRVAVLTIIYARDGKLRKPPHVIHNMHELNTMGVFFNQAGPGDDGLVVKLPAESAPPPFRWEDIN